MTDVTAAGILFVTPDKLALFLKRGNGSDYPNFWCCPGGRLEGNETAEEGAIRETEEESGAKVKPGDLRFLTQSRLPSEDGQSTVDFTTYRVVVPDNFTPVLCHEHDGYAWAPIDKPPEPLHPGVSIALDRLTMDELDVARAIADGRLTSPQRYENVWLYAIRITGTGASYRQSLDEFVWRDPSLYMNERFLARCNGLPVIMEHPKKTMLSSDEYKDRNIGSIFLPYLKAESNEVWGIAKVFDAPAVKILNEMDLSTSPAVVFRGIDNGNTKMTLDDGSALLIEGKPSLLDHVAICEKGVWDKGGEPTGVQVDSLSAIGDTAVPEEKIEDRKDEASAGEKLDKLLTKMDAMEGRLDAMETANCKADEDKDETKEDANEENEESEREVAKADGKKADAEEEEEEREDDDEEEEGEPERVVADKGKRKDAARKDGPTSPLPKQQRTPEQDKAIKEYQAKHAKGDAEEDEEEREDRNMSRHDSDNSDLRRRIADLEKVMPRQLSDADHQAFADAQARADTVFQAFGDSAPRPLMGEDVMTYRRRLAGSIKGKSKTWSKTNLHGINDDNAFSVIEDSIYADAMDAAHHPTDLKADELRPIYSTDVTGRRTTSFAGEPRAWMDAFSGSRRRLVGVRQGGVL